MTEIELSPIALEHLGHLAKSPGEVPDLPELEVLWRERFIMGSKARCHITAKGKSFWMALQPTPPEAD